MPAQPSKSEVISIKDFRVDPEALDKFVGMAKDRPVGVNNALVGRHLNVIARRTSPLEQAALMELVEKITQDADLEKHLETIFSLNPRSVGTYETLKDACEEFRKDQNADSNQWSPTRVEALFASYLKFGQSELNLLMKIFGTLESGGLGWGLRSQKYSIGRWKIDEQEKVIYLPEWYTGILHLPTDNLGGKTQRVTNELAAQFLKDAIHEKFLGEEDYRAALNRQTMGVVSAGIALQASFAAGPITVVFVLLPQVIEGVTEAASDKPGQAFNPAREAFGKIGSLIDEKTGKETGETVYNLASILVCVGDSVKSLARLPASEAEFVSEVQNVGKQLEAKQPAAFKSKRSPKKRPPTTGKGANKFESDKAREWYKKVDELDFSTGYGESVFYSGIKKGPAMAEAKEFGKKTIEMTPGGKWLDEQELFDPANLPFLDAVKVWRKASAKFAQNASGPVRVIERVRDYEGMRRSAFRNVELNYLRRNPAVTDIQHRLIWKDTP